MNKPLTFATAARMLTHKCIQYTGVPDGRGGFTRQADEMLDADIALYDLAREVLRLAPEQRRGEKR